MQNYMIVLHFSYRMSRDIFLLEFIIRKSLFVLKNWHASSHQVRRSVQSMMSPFCPACPEVQSETARFLRGTPFALVGSMLTDFSFICLSFSTYNPTGVWCKTLPLSFLSPSWKAGNNKVLLYVSQKSLKGEGDATPACWGLGPEQSPSLTATPSKKGLYTAARHLCIHVSRMYLWNKSSKLPILKAFPSVCKYELNSSS